MALVGFKARNHPQQRAKPEVDEMQTPPELFDPLNERFGFTVDVAATVQNAKLEHFYTPADDGLKQSWMGERVWCNPPYSSIEPWVEKAWNSAAGLVVMLVPANRTEQGWWQRQVEPYRDRHVVCGYCRAEQWPHPPQLSVVDVLPLRVEFIAKRQRFIRYQADAIKPNERPPFGVCLLIWESRPGVSAHGDI